MPNFILYEFIIGSPFVNHLEVLVPGVRVGGIAAHLHVGVVVHGLRLAGIVVGLVDAAPAVPPPRRGFMETADCGITVIRGFVPCLLVVTGKWLIITISRPRLHARPAYRGNGDVRAGECSSPVIVPRVASVIGGPPLLTGRAADRPALVLASAAVYVPAAPASQPGEEFLPVFRGVGPHRIWS